MWGLIWWGTKSICHRWGELSSGSTSLIYKLAFCLALPSAVVPEWMTWMNEIWNGWIGVLCPFKGEYWGGWIINKKKKREIPLFPASGYVKPSWFTQIMLDWTWLNYTDTELGWYWTWLSTSCCFFLQRGWTESLYTFLQTTDDTIRCKNNAIVLRK